MLDLVSFYTAAVATATATELTCLDTAKVQEGRGDPKLVALTTQGANNQYGRLQTPSMGRHSIYVPGVTTASTMENKGINRMNPMVSLVPSEEIVLETYQDSGGNELETGYALLSYGTPKPAPASTKPAIGVRFQVGTAPVAATWTKVQTDIFSGSRDILPDRTYYISKATYFAADALQFRFACNSFGANRPGGSAGTDVGQPMFDFKAIQDVPVFKGSESVDLWVLASGVTQGYAIIELQEM